MLSFACCFFNIFSQYWLSVFFRQQGEYFISIFHKFQQSSAKPAWIENVIKFSPTRHHCCPELACTLFSVIEFNFMYNLISMNGFIELWVFCCRLHHYSTHSEPDNALSTVLAAETPRRTAYICRPHRQDEFSYASVDHLTVHRTFCIH